MAAKNELKSLSVYLPYEIVIDSITELGFSLFGNVTVIADGKFWKKMIFKKDNQTIALSEEIGDAYPKDPIITLFASEHTCKKIESDISKHLP
jgi:hypothetical protein